MGSFTGVVAATSGSKGSSSYTFLLLIVLVFVGFYFLMIRPQRRRQQQAQQQQKTLSPGSRVRTTAGMYATVSAVDGDDVILEVAPGVDVRYMRRSVMEVLTAGEDEETELSDETELHDAEYGEYGEDDLEPDGEYVEDEYADDEHVHDAEDGHVHDGEPSDVDADGTETAEPGSGDVNHARSGKDNVF
jgi:preprotein translocase subunit YajC